MNHRDTEAQSKAEVRKRRIQKFLLLGVSVVN